MKSFCVIGLGKFGRNLALLLAGEGAQVFVMDKNPEVINAIADSVTTAVVGDPTNEDVLLKIGIANFDCVIVSMVSNVNDSIMTTLLCKEQGVKQLIARAADEKHKKVLEKIGADTIIFPELDSAEKLSRTLTMSNVIDYIEFSDDYSIIEIPIPSRWVGRSILEIDIRKNYNVTVISRRRGGKLEISPSPKVVFESGDTVSLLGHNTDIEKIAETRK